MLKKRKPLSFNAKLFIITAVTAVTLYFIWGQSCIGTETSEAESGAVLEFIEATTGGLTRFIHNAKWYIRKFAHFVEYGVLGFEFGIYAWLHGRDYKHTFIYCLMQAIFVALVDETLQLFTDRGSSVADQWVDAAGTLTGILILLGIRLLHERAREKKAAEKTEK